MILDAFVAILGFVAGMLLLGLVHADIEEQNGKHESENREPMMHYFMPEQPKYPPRPFVTHKGERR